MQVGDGACPGGPERQGGPDEVHPTFPGDPHHSGVRSVVEKIAPHVPIAGIVGGSKVELSLHDGLKVFGLFKDPSYRILQPLLGFSGVAKFLPRKPMVYVLHILYRSQGTWQYSRLQISGV